MCRRLYTCIRKRHKFWYSGYIYKAYDGKKGSFSEFQIWRLAYTLLPFNLRSDAVWITFTNIVVMETQWGKKYNNNNKITTLHISICHVVVCSQAFDVVYVRTTDCFYDLRVSYYIMYAEYLDRLGDNFRFYGNCSILYYTRYLGMWGTTVSRVKIYIFRICVGVCERRRQNVTQRWAVGNGRGARDKRLLSEVKYT